MTKTLINNCQQILSSYKRVNAMPSIIDTITPVLRKIPGVTTIVHRLSFIQNIISNKKYNYYKNLEPEKYPQELSHWYQHATGKSLDLENPKTFNEKIQWIKLYDSSPLKTQLADKYLVREYISEKIGDEYLIPLLGVWDSFDEIDFDILPNQFVLKANHGSGWNIIVRDKSKFDRRDAKKKIDKWMKTNFAYNAGLEMHYKDIPPKVIAEEYLENSNGELADYKFHCYSGNPEYIQCMTGRANHDTLREKIYDFDWNPLPFVQNYERYEGEIKKPCDIPKMVSLARKLSEDFIYVRVDFYVLDNGSVKFGEMTFTPGSGMGSWNLPEYDLKYGDMIKLPE